MGFLAPFFLAGLAAVAAPVLFHMIRRTPKGQVPFSTLMFLEPSPPRVTSRSKIEHWLLLLLRASAVILLALAFSRPFLRQTEDMLLDGNARRVAILIDTSASMRRSGLWEQTLKHANAALDELGRHDSVAVFAFDRELRPIVTFKEWHDLDRSHAMSFVKKKVEELKPGWHGTNLGSVLPEAVTASLDRSRDDSAEFSTELIVISDLQRGSRIEPLQVFNWPENVSVSVRSLDVPSKSNSGLQIVGRTVASAGLRVRLDNAEDSSKERFDVHAEQREVTLPIRSASAVEQASATEQKPQIVQAAHERDSATIAVRDVVVPPNQNRVVRFDDLPDHWHAFCLTLTGDEVDFDNQAWFVKPQPSRVTVEYLGRGESSDPESLRYYVERAFMPTPEREVDFVASDAPSFVGQTSGGLLIVAQELDAKYVDAVSKAVRNGSHVAVVGSSIDICRQAFAIAGRETPEMTEATVDGYAMLSDVDLTHPLLAEYNDARLANFTTLAIWKHRNFKSQSASKDVRVLAKFDGGSPAILEMEQGKGRVTLFQFGWFDGQSEFFKWSKFAPILNELVDATPGRIIQPARLTVGDTIRLDQIARLATGEVEVTPPSESWGSKVQSSSKLSLNEPGIYRVSWKTQSGPRSAALAVNLDPLESRTSSIGLDELRTLGVPLEGTVAAAESAEETRQLQSRELESRQRAWQWVIMAAILLLLAETWIAGRLTVTEPSEVK